MWLCCSQFITPLNKCKVQSSTFSTGNPLIQVAIVSLQVKLVTILLGWLSKKFSRVDLRIPGAIGAFLPRLSSLFSEKFSESGRSNDGSGGVGPLGKECP